MDWGVRLSTNARAQYRDLDAGLQEEVRAEAAEVAERPAAFLYPGVSPSTGARVSIHGYWSGVVAGLFVELRFDPGFDHEESLLHLLEIRTTMFPDLEDDHG